MKALLLALSMLSVSAFAQESDMVLEGAKWQAKFTDYKCAAFGTAAAQPTAHAKFNVVFEKIVTDSSLDNGLITASFTQDGKACRYNAIIFADNAASTMKLVDSKAYALAQDSDCAEGKAVLDESFAANNYLYWGHPHNLTVMMNIEGAAASCGTDLVGVNFVVSGRIK